MTRSSATPLARLLLTFLMTMAALFGSVSVASVASADDDAPSSTTQPAEDVEGDDEDYDGEDVDAEDADEAKEDDEDGQEGKDGKDGDDEAATPSPVVEYVDGDVVDKLGNLVKAKAPRWASKYDAVAPKLRNALAQHLTKKGATVIQDSRGRLVIAPYLCNTKKPTWLQPGCVTSLPTQGGGRF